MEIFKQILAAFAEKGIPSSDLLEVHFDMLYEVLYPHCRAYGKRIPSLAESVLETLYRETSAILLQRFRKQDIALRDIHIENSEAVLEKYTAVFIFIFQQRLLDWLKQQNRFAELLVELLEDFEKHGIKELEPGGIGRLQQRILSLLQGIEKENVSPTEVLTREFIIAKLSQGWASTGDILENGAFEREEIVKGGRVSQLKLRLKKRLQDNRRVLEELLLAPTAWGA